MKEKFVFPVGARHYYERRLVVRKDAHVTHKIWYSIHLGTPEVRVWGRVRVCKSVVLISSTCAMKHLIKQFSR